MKTYVTDVFKRYANTLLIYSQMNQVIMNIIYTKKKINYQNTRMKHYRIVKSFKRNNYYWVVGVKMINWKGSCCEVGGRVVKRASLM